MMSAFVNPVLLLQNSSIYASCSDSLILVSMFLGFFDGGLPFAGDIICTSFLVTHLFLSGYTLNISIMYPKVNIFFQNFSTLPMELK